MTAMCTRSGLDALGKPLGASVNFRLPASRNARSLTTRQLKSWRAIRATVLAR